MTAATVVESLMSDEETSCFTVKTFQLSNGTYVFKKAHSPFYLNITFTGEKRYTEYHIYWRKEVY